MAIWGRRHPVVERSDALDGAILKDRFGWIVFYKYESIFTNKEIFWQFIHEITTPVEELREKYNNFPIELYCGTVRTAEDIEVWHEKGFKTVEEAEQAVRLKITEKLGIPVEDFQSQNVFEDDRITDFDPVDENHPHSLEGMPLGHVDEYQVVTAQHTTI